MNNRLSNEIRCPHCNGTGLIEHEYLDVMIPCDNLVHKMIKTNVTDIIKAMTQVLGGMEVMPKLCTKR